MEINYSQIERIAKNSVTWFRRRPSAGEGRPSPVDRRDIRDIREAITIADLYIRYAVVPPHPDGDENRASTMVRVAYESRGFRGFRGFRGTRE